MLASCASLNSTAGFGCSGLAMRFGIAAGSGFGSTLASWKPEADAAAGRTGSAAAARRAAAPAHRPWSIHGRRVVVAARGARGLLLPIRGEARGDHRRRRRLIGDTVRGAAWAAAIIVMAMVVVLEGLDSAGATETVRAKTGDGTGAWSTATPVEASGERAALV